MRVTHDWAAQLAEKKQGFEKYVRALFCLEFIYPRKCVWTMYNDAEEK
jgi:hypothetical protein